MTRNTPLFISTYCFVFLSSFLGDAVFSQTVEIAANPATTTNYVFGTNAYAANESIYTEEEIGAANFTTVASAINQLAFNIATVGTNTNFTDVTIWMKEVPLVTTTFTTGTYSTAGYTQVFNGSVTAAAEGWVTIPLAVSFQRTINNNLQVLVERNDGVSHPGFVYRTASGNNTGNTAASSRRYNSTEPLSATTMLTTSAFRSQIRLQSIPPVPVTLINFEVKRSGKANLLMWTTAQELNTARFVVERSADGRGFEPIGEVLAAGNSNTIRTYSLPDFSPGGGVNFYRLKIVDIDQVSSYSAIRSISNAALTEIMIYPNPAKAFFNLKVNAPKQEIARLEIVNGAGTRVMSKDLFLGQGNNVERIAINALPRGSYVIKVSTNDGIVVRKLERQ